MRTKLLQSPQGRAALMEGRPDDLDAIDKQILGPLQVRALAVCYGCLLRKQSSCACFARRFALLQERSSGFLKAGQQAVPQPSEA